MGEKARNDPYEAFVGEAKAHHRLLVFAGKAKKRRSNQEWVQKEGKS